MRVGAESLPPEMVLKVQSGVKINPNPSHTVQRQTDLAESL